MQIMLMVGGVLMKIINVKRKMFRICKNAIPTTPSIQYVAPNISVPYCGSTDIAIPITNNGDGVARNFKLKIDRISQDYQISNIGAKIGVMIQIQVEFSSGWYTSRNYKFSTSSSFNF